MLKQGTELILFDTPFIIGETTTPSTVIANTVKFYAKDKAGTSALYLQDDAGSEREVGPANQVTGTGTADRLAYWTSSSVIGATSALIWNATDNVLGIGTATPAFALEIQGGTNALSNIVIKEASADTTSPGLALLKARGTLGSEAATNSGDILGALGFGGWTNAYKFNAARIEAVAGSLWTATNSESYLTFATTPNASTTRAERMRIHASGAISIGGTETGITIGGDARDSNLIIHDEVAAQVENFGLHKHTDTAGIGANMFLVRSRGTEGAETAVSADDRLGRISFLGHDGTDYERAAQILVEVDGTPGAGDMPGRMRFLTTPDGSTTPSERFRIGSAGQWGIGGATYGTAGYIFKSGGASAAPTWTAPADVTAGSTKITLGGTPTGASLVAFSIDVNQANLDHGSIGGLSDDDHSGYALLAGRSGGQTLIGGTGVADDLTLRATAGIGAGSETITFQLGNNGALTAAVLANVNSQGILRINGAADGSPFSIRNLSDAVNAFTFTGDGANASVSFSRYQAVNSGVVFSTTKGRGTASSPSQTLNGDTSLLFLCSGVDDTAANSGNLALLQAAHTENVTTTAGGMSWEFYTVPNTTKTQTLAMRLENGADLHIQPVGTADVELEVSNGASQGGGTVHAASFTAHSSIKRKAGVVWLDEPRFIEAINSIKQLKPVKFRYLSARKKLVQTETGLKLIPDADDLFDDPQSSELEGYIFEEAPDSIKGKHEDIALERRLFNVELALKEVLTAVGL